MSSLPSAGWAELANGVVSLRFRRALPQINANDFDSKTFLNRSYIVLPKPFGVNVWVRSVADRLAAQGYSAFAIPFFDRMAPEVALGYEPSNLVEGRRHKDATTANQILADVVAVLDWLRVRYPEVAINVVGVCFGGHTAFLAATLPGVEQVFDFYGAGFSGMRPGGGELSRSVEQGPNVARVCFRHSRLPHPR